MANQFIAAMVALWNNGATLYYGIKMNVTNSASDAASKLLALQVGGADKFTVDPAGKGVFAGDLSAVAATFSGALTGTTLNLSGTLTGVAATFSGNVTGSRFITSAGGSAAAPSLTIGTGDPDTGWYSVSDNVWGFSAGGTVRVTFSTTGINAAPIGATTPSTGAFTTLAASGAFSLTGDQVQLTEGGTGATTAAGARTALGLVIGTDVQAFSTKLSTLAGQTWAADTISYQTGTAALSTTPLTSFARTVIDDTTGAAMFATLGAVTSQAASGYVKLPDGTLIQYGTITPGGGVSDFTLTFPTAFPTACRAVIALPVYNNSGSTEFAAVNVSSIIAASCLLRTRYLLGSGPVTTTSAMPINWIAIGY